MGSDARGLAGLASELQALADTYDAPGGPGHEEFEKGLRTAYLIAAGKVQKLAADFLDRAHGFLRGRHWASVIILAVQRIYFSQGATGPAKDGEAT